MSQGHGFLRKRWLSSEGGMLAWMEAGPGLRGDLQSRAPGQAFVVDGFEIRDLGAVLEVLADAGGGVLAEGLPEAGLGGEAVEVVEEAVAVAFLDEEAGDVIGDGFGDAAVVGSEHGEAGGHGFQHGVGDAFLVLVRRGLAGVEEPMGLVIELAEGRGVEETGEGDFFRYAQFGSQLFQIGQQGAFASDGKMAVRVGFAELGKSGEGEGEAFFLDEAAGLDETPFAIGREGAAGGDGEGVHGDAGPV